MKLLLITFIIVLTSIHGFGQKKKQESQSETVSSAIETKVSGMKKYSGYVEFYFDEKQDKIFLVIDKLNLEFIYVQGLTAGIGSNDIGLDRNQIGRERIVKFERRGPKLLLIEPNIFYRAVSDNLAEREAVEQSFAQSILWGFPVLAEEGNKILVEATDFFMQDTHGVASRLKNMKQGNYSLDKSRSAFFSERIKNFPQNSEFEVTLTFTGEASGEYIESVVPTPNAVTVRQHHSFVQLPDSNFKPRKFDPRSGYYNLSYYDYATPINESLEKRFITRHRLEKKNPTALLSEPVKPIIYYMDPGAPEPIRSALMEGTRWWNQAFEAAGYKDAFRVELLPEDADPMDVRYNLINWVHRSTRGWSYGGGVTDPRTGEIIKGHVVLGSLRVRQDFLIAEGLLAPYEDGKPVSKEMEQLALNRLKQLAAHEVGHTLGLAHAYSSSSENRSSVMDYPQPLAKLINGKIDISDAYDDKIGEWDKVSIAFGYQDFPDGVNEDKALEEIVQNSLKDGLTFLSDQDARPMGSAHPFTHLWDNGREAADELNRMLEIRSVVLRNFGEKNIKSGTPMAMLEEALVPMYFYHRYQTEAAAKLIGGLNYRYALKGDGQMVTAFVSAEQQQKALDALIKTVSPANLMLQESLLKIIPPRPLGYDRHREVIKIRTELTFDALSMAETAADMTFSLVLHPARTSRLVEYHARDAKQPSLESVIDKLINETVKSPVKNGYEGAVKMTVNYALLINLTKLALNISASSQSRAIANLKLDQLKSWLSTQSKITPDEAWHAHYSFLIMKINKLQEDPDKFKQENLLEAPPGQPIGMDEGFCGN
jgi:Met-zincin/Domain of unknown function (DUF5117)